MNPPRILIVDDEANIRLILERTLRQEGYLLETAVDGADALKKITAASYDLLLLDLWMEPVDGMQVLRSVRAKDPDCVVIILTAHSSLDSAVSALRLGAFDYLFKPAASAEIRQRVREGLQQRQQALRHRRLLSHLEDFRQALDETSPPELFSPPPVRPPDFLQAGNLIIDRRHRAATLADQLLDLTTTEFDLLLCLVNAAPVPLSAQELASQALGYNSDEIDVRDVIKWHIHHLRHKIEPDPAHPRYIKTIRYKGYFWSGK